MIPGFEKIVEERIKQARQQGAFNNLQGAGKPIEYEDDGGIPEDLRLAHKILKNAGFVPPAIELKKEISKTEDLLAGMEETSEKYHVLKRLNYLEMKLRLCGTSSKQFEVPNSYKTGLLKRLGSKSG